MQTWLVTNPSGPPVAIQGEDLVSAMSRHREALLALAFPGGVEAVETAWMHWDQDLLDGNGAVEVILTGLRAGTEQQGRLLIDAAPGEIAPDTGRAVFF
ncbi:hypothetical protein ACFW16_00495 [Inquilinus sp. NPDC058860]|uniref:hypothetical protein n=1 Tax=Inquilinus sp. NPDC058860 TaxID=3346652 RepID=UPI0036AC98C3